MCVCKTHDRRWRRRALLTLIGRGAIRWCVRNLIWVSPFPPANPSTTSRRRHFAEAAVTPAHTLRTPPRQRNNTHARYQTRQINENKTGYLVSEWVRHGYFACPVSIDIFLTPSSTGRYSKGVAAGHVPLTRWPSTSKAGFRSRSFFFFFTAEPRNRELFGLLRYTRNGSILSSAIKTVLGAKQSIISLFLTAVRLETNRSCTIRKKRTFSRVVRPWWTYGVRRRFARAERRRVSRSCVGWQWRCYSTIPKTLEIYYRLWRGGNKNSLISDHGYL